MSNSKIAVVYFTATHVTRTYADVMRETLLEQGCDVQFFDVTAHAARQKPLRVEEFDGLIFGFPVFSDFAPSVVNDWLPTLNGQNKKCAQFFTYGARTTGYAHFHTKLLLEQAGFQVLFSAEFLGRHSFNVAGWRVAPDRPNDQDFAIAQDFCALATERFSQSAPAPLELQKPFGYDRATAALQKQQETGSGGSWAEPKRGSEACCMCRDCETGCPTQAFNADTGLSDPDLCIDCMHCVAICPDQVIQVHERAGNAYEGFSKSWHLTEDMMNAKQSKIITQAWQAAF